MSPAQQIEKISAECGLSAAGKGSKVLVTLSGGLDSTVVLYFARHLGLAPIGIQFNYQSRPAAERASLAQICRLTGISLFTFQYPQIQHNGYSAFRFNLAESNGLYYMMAANFAAINGIEFILGGLIKEDSEDPQGQNSKYLVDRINQLASIEFSERPPRVIMPFIDLDKSAVVSLGRFLNVPLEQTWSCEQDLLTPCGVCGNCRIRTAAIG